MALLALATARSSPGVLIGSGGFFCVMVASAGVGVLAVIVASYAVLFARADEPRYTQQQCDAARSEFADGDFNGRIDDVLSECARQGR